MYQNQQSGTNNGGMVPEAKQALNNMKFEIANELGINLKQGYNGDMPSRQSRHLFEAICQKLEKTKEDGNPLTPNYQEIYDIALRGCRQTAPRHSRLGSKVSEFLHSCTERMGL